MEIESIEITEYNDSRDRNKIIELWKEVFSYETAHNNPGLVISKKLQIDDGLFFVALHEKSVIGTIMAGYDGHRGWIYTLAVKPVYQKSGIGKALLEHAEKKLASLGCVKINLQVLETNKDVEAFYIANGYLSEKRISMGKVLSQNV